MKQGVFVWFLTILLANFSSVSNAAAEWTTACREKRCQLYNQLLQKDGTVLGRVYFQRIRASAVPLAKEKDSGKSSKKEAANLQYEVVAFAGLPLGLYIPSGVTVKIDDKMTFRAELLDCQAKEGCRAVFMVQPATIDAMSSGKNLSFLIVDGSSRRALSFNYSLQGFAAAYADFLKKAKAEK